MVETTTGISSELHKMGLYEIGKQSQVGVLVHDWVASEIEKDKQARKVTTAEITSGWQHWADELRDKVGHLVFFDGISLFPRVSTSRIVIDTQRYGNIKRDTERSLLRIRGHMFSDTALRGVAEVFGEPIDDKFAQLKEARDADNQAWKDMLLDKILTTPDPKIFINALCVFHDKASYADMRDFYYLEKDLESLGIAYQPFVRQLWNKAGQTKLELEPEFSDWLIETFKLTDKPEILERLKSFTNHKGTLPDGSAPAMTEMEIKAARKEVTRFRKMFAYAVEKSTMSLEDLSRLVTIDTANPNGLLVPVYIPKSAKSLVGSIAWPSAEQFEKLCSEFQKRSGANERDKWFDKPFPAELPANQDSLKITLDIAYPIACKAREKLVAAGIDIDIKKGSKRE